MLDSALIELAAQQSRDAQISTAVLLLVCGIGAVLALLAGSLALLAVLR